MLSKLVLRSGLPLAALGLLVLTCTPRDILQTCETDTFNHGGVLESNQFEFAAGLPLPGVRADMGAGFGSGREARMGWSYTGVHEYSDGHRLSTFDHLHALELRLRQRLLDRGPLRANIGAGLDVILGNEGARWRYYGLRPMVQAACGCYTGFGLGLFVPLAVSYTHLRAREADGFSVTPGLGIAFEHERFFIRLGGNVPAGGYFTDNDSLVREMLPCFGFHLGVRAGGGSLEDFQW